MSTSSRFSAKSMPGTPSSRGQSPRRLRDTGEARLRPEVASRSPANRHSANLNSTLQQDLMKLISPEYLSSDDSALNKVFIDALSLHQESKNLSIISTPE